MTVVETTHHVNKAKRVRSTISSVEVYGIGNLVYIQIIREYPGNRQIERRYHRPYISCSQNRLSSCIHLGVLRGTAYTRPWLGGGLGWTARDKPFKV